MRKLICTAIAFVIITGTVFSQGMPDPAVPQGKNLQVPEGWEVRLDKPNDDIIVGSNPDSSDIYFVNMTPGWHLTTGPRAIFWHPENVATGNFKIITSIYTFDTKGRDREGFGLFFGGSDLNGENQEYLYFLIRNTGDFLIKARRGSETEIIHEWTASDAIVRFTEESTSSELNHLSVTVTGGIMTFVINETEVASLLVENLKTDGHFGLRVNHAVNIHISDLGVELINSKIDDYD